MNEEQKKRAIQIWKKYYAEGEESLNASQEYTQRELDQRRREIIPEVLQVLQAYLSGQSALEEFKSKIDSINKRNRLWGFQGINGQMFFNILTKISALGEKTADLENFLKRSLPLPESPQQAAHTIDEFAQFAKGLGKYVKDLRGAPKPGSTMFFLSYFWQAQAPDQCPIYYVSMVDALKEYNLWLPAETYGASYASFYQISHKLLDLFSRESGQKLTLWDVEHAFWFVVQPEPLMEPSQKPSVSQPVPIVKNITELELPDSYIPPVVSILPRLAANDPELAKLCQAMGSSIEKVFENRLDVLLKMLGYETEALGQGHGRVPDGVAICREFHYAIGYDAKVRQQGYTMGIDERAIREYIVRLTDRLKKLGIRQIYFMIVSSSFSGDHDDVIRSLKMDTDVREVLLVEAGALLALLEAKLRYPLLTLGPEGIQRLLANSGLLTEANAREFQGL